MSVDLNNTFKYDKIVINLNSTNCLEFTSGKTDYYINLAEPLKNVIYIKMIRASVRTNNSTITTSPFNYKKNDPIYISINDYDRSVSYKIFTEITPNTTKNIITGTVSNTGTNSSNIVFHPFNYFDLIPYSYDTISTEQYSEISYTQASFDWSDPSVYILNPPEQNLKRFNIKFKNKAFELFNTSDLINFNLSICVYVIKNRV
jgi:hypothetical protein